MRSQNKIWESTNNRLPKSWGGGGGGMWVGPGEEGVGDMGGARGYGWGQGRRGWGIWVGPGEEGVGIWVGPGEEGVGDMGGARGGGGGGCGGYGWGQGRRGWGDVGGATPLPTPSVSKFAIFPDFKINKGSATLLRRCSKVVSSCHALIPSS